MMGVEKLYCEESKRRGMGGGKETKMRNFSLNISKKDYYSLSFLIKSRIAIYSSTTTTT
jgi:hypothetical protein